MITVKRWKSYYEDNLILRITTHDNKLFSQGKRLPKGASNQLRRVQKEYVKNGAASAVKLIRDEEGLSLKDSVKTFNVLRGKDYFSWEHLT